MDWHQCFINHGEFLVFLLCAVVFRITLGPGDPAICKTPIVPLQSTPPQPTYRIDAPAPQGLQTGDGDISDWIGIDGYEYIFHLFEPYSDPFIKTQKNYTFVMYYLPDCPFSKYAQPEFAAAAKAISANSRNAPASSTASMNMRFASVNCNQNRRTCKDHGITEIPMFLLYKDGYLVEEFTKRRVVGEFLKYAMDPPTGGAWFKWQ